MSSAKPLNKSSSWLHLRVFSQFFKCISLYCISILTAYILPLLSYSSTWLSLNLKILVTFGLNMSNYTIQFHDLHVVSGRVDHSSPPSIFWHPEHCTVLIIFLPHYSFQSLVICFPGLTTVGCSRALYTQLDIFGHKDETISTTTHISSLDLFEFQTHMPICLFERLRWSLAGMSNVYVPSLIPYLSRHLKCLCSKSNLLSSTRVRINSESS